MRSKALSFLLSLSLMFCVGFGSSLTASAATSEQFDFVCEIHNYENDPSDIEYGSGAVLLRSSNSTTPQLEFDVIIPRTALTGYVNGYYDFMFVLHNSLGTTISYTFEIYDYNNNLLYSGSASRSGGLNSSVTTYLRTNAFLTDSSSVGRIHFDFNWSSSNGFETALMTISRVGVSSDGDISSVVAAIQQQTSDIQQSIQDQYGGDPDDSFPVDDIITQHNEKMGVLSFSSEALMQVLGLLSPDQTLSSELVFPSMSLTIAGQRNRVQLWPEYRFDLNTLKQHWPDFIGLMQSLTSALVWIFVLRYCYRVFEKYFLAGGGS